MSNFNLVNFGELGEPAAEVANNFMNKISNALGWIVTPRGIKPHISEANKSLIEEIANRTDINPIERAAIVNNYMKIVKQYKTQNDIVQIALAHLDKKAEPEKISNDWLSFFFDHVKDITDDEMKILWGRILSGEVNEPNTFTKQFLHTMSIMDAKLAKSFQKIRSSCFYSPPYLYAFIYKTNRSNINNTKKYQDMGIYISDLKELDNLGVINYRFSDFHEILIQNQIFYYGDSIITFNTDKKSIALGNVSLTRVGKQLCKISSMVYDHKILEICMDAWTKLGYNPVIKTGAQQADQKLL